MGNADGAIRSGHARSCAHLATSLTDEDATLSRRQWREKHKPVVRRRGVVFALADDAVVPISVVMFGASWGSRGGSVTPDDSAWWIVWCSALMGVALAIIMIRLIVERDHASLSVSGTVFVAVVGALSMLVVLSRNEGVISTPIIVMFFSNVACLIVGCVAVAVAAAREPLPEDED